MWKTVLFLLFTLIAFPILVLYFDEFPTDYQWKVIRLTTITYIISAGITFIVSTLANNYSQVDKLWSLIPILYGWQIYTCYSGDMRLFVMAVLISIWGARLTFNFARRGGYSWKFWSGDEDYRWAILRTKPEFNGKWKWFLFNLFFISFYQLGLILLITYPMIKASEGKDLNVVDIILAILIVVLVVFEFIADQQQYDFQTEKHRRIKAGEPLNEYAKGFNDKGLWSIVRHPNYAAEQSIWIVTYFFSVNATGHWFNWSGVGALLLVLLFKGSSDFSEAISAEKYPEYKAYQKSTPRFIPFLKIK